MIAQVITPWVTDASGSNTPDLANKYKDLSMTIVDATGQAESSVIPSPNLFTVLIEASTETIEILDGDSDYYVLWDA